VPRSAVAPLGLTTEGDTKVKLKGWKCYPKKLQCIDAFFGTVLVLFIYIVWKEKALPAIWLIFLLLREGPLNKILRRRDESCERLEMRISTRICRSLESRCFFCEKSVSSFSFPIQVLLIYDESVRFCAIHSCFPVGDTFGRHNLFPLLGVSTLHAESYSVNFRGRVL